MNRAVLGRLLPPLTPMLGWCVVMETLARTGVVPFYLIPAPSLVLQSMWEGRADLLSAAWQTLSASLLGLAASFTLGTLVAVALSLSSLARRAFYPYAVFFQTVPVIAIAPVLVIWFGFGRPTVVASALIVSIFPIIASTLLGLQSTDPGLVDLFRLYGSSRYDRLVKLRIPSALPQIFSGLRIGAGLSVIGAIVGEFVAGGGLGSVVDAARTQQRTDLVFAAVLISALIGLIVTASVGMLSRRFLGAWHVSEREPRTIAGE